MAQCMPKMHQILLRVLPTVWHWSCVMSIILASRRARVQPWRGWGSEDYCQHLLPDLSHVVYLQNHPHRRKPLKVQAKAKHKTHSQISNVAVSSGENVVVEWLTLLLLIWEVPGSYLRPYTNYLGSCFVVFLRPSRQMSGSCVKIRKRTLPSRSFPNHHSLDIFYIRP
jgi:hypothetical protein